MLWAISKNLHFARQMKRGRDEMDLLKSHHLMCLTWLWVVKVDPLIGRCVNKDIAKKIVGYLRTDLRDGINGLYLHSSFYGDTTIWYWSHINNKRNSYHRPCVGCLNPIKWTGMCRSDLRCDDCAPLINECEHNQCCDRWGHSIVSKCFEPFRKIYILPE